MSPDGREFAPEDVDRVATVRRAMESGLRSMQAELDRFDHTTHGAMGDGRIESVLSALLTAYRMPTAFNLSTASQLIRRFLDSVERARADAGR